MTRGSALLEILIVGALICLAVAQGAVAAGRLHAAGDRATEAAQVAASWSARHGDATGAQAIAASLAPDALQVDASRSGDEITVAVHIRVGLLGNGGPSRVVTGRATARISDYRSNRG